MDIKESHEFNAIALHHFSDLLPWSSFPRTSTTTRTQVEMGRLICKSILQDDQRSSSWWTGLSIYPIQGRSVQVRH